MAKRLLFAGDANADIVLSGLKDRPQEDREIVCEGFLSTLGGSSTLAAAAYAHLGGSCDFCGLVGDDENGHLVASALSEAGVGLDLLRMSAKARTGVTVSLVRGSTRTQVTYPGSMAEVDESDVLLDKLDGYDHLHLAGIYGTPRFLPRVAEVLAAAKAAGLTTSLDPQWDPAENWRFVDDWLPMLSWFFVNEDEALSIAKRLSGGRTPPSVEEVWGCLAGITARPIIKLGPRGVFSGGRTFPAFPVDVVVDPTGAGDSFAAAFLLATIEDGAALDDALPFAQAAGALACGYEGGSSAKLSRESVERMLKQDPRP